MIAISISLSSRLGMKGNEKREDEEENDRERNEESRSKKQSATLLETGDASPFLPLVLSLGCDEIHNALIDVVRATGISGRCG